MDLLCAKLSYFPSFPPSLSITGAPRNPFSQLGPCKMPLPQLLDCLAQVFAFFWTDVLCRNDQVRTVRTVRNCSLSYIHALHLVVVVYC